MSDSTFRDTIRLIYSKDPRYAPESYIFMREALDFAIKIFNKPVENQRKHITPNELLDGIREYCLQEFGPMSLTVLKNWGIKSTEDFGEIVFNLVESGVLGKTETDRKEDFMKGYDFFSTFAKPFIPASTAAEPANKRKRTPSKQGRTKR